MLLMTKSHNMKFTFYLFLLITICSNALSAQLDVVSMGSSYSKAAFYNLSTGESVQLANESWDIIFSNTDINNAGVFINESTTFMQPGLELYAAPTNNWTEEITDVSIFTEEFRLYNPELSWSEGAFNILKDSLNEDDYGWGIKNTATNTIEGTRVFVIKKRNGLFIKFQIISLEDNVFSLRTASLDGSNEKSFSISKTNYQDQALIFFSLESESVKPISISYDMIFLRYTEPLDAGNNTFVEYTITGMLLAPGVEAAAALDVDPSTVQESDYSEQYTSRPGIIGGDWKYFDLSQGWIIDFERTYFVKSIDGNKYQLVFIDFGGSSTGSAIIEKTLLIPTSTFQPSTNDISIFPNPASDYLSIEINGQEIEEIIIFNTTGQVVAKEKRTNTYFNLPQSLHNGIYSVIIRTKDSVYQKNIFIKQN